MKEKKKKSKVPFLLFALLAVFTLWGNATVGTTRYTYVSDTVPEAFNGYKIAQVSDLHNTYFANIDMTVLDILRNENPDIIVITGDIVDASKTDIDIAVHFAEQAVKIAPCFMATGNHEAWLFGEYHTLERRLTDAGVIVIRDDSRTLRRGDDSILLMALDDPDFKARDEEEADAKLREMIASANSPARCRILLSHRPEMFSAYVNNNVDLVLSGHAHGGQFRIPFIGGVFAPDQGLLPTYDAGDYKDKNTTMYVSRGIGNSVIPVRFNNRPEVVIVTLSDHIGFAE